MIVDDVACEGNGMRVGEEELRSWITALIVSNWCEGRAVSSEGQEAVWHLCSWMASRTNTYMTMFHYAAVYTIRGTCIPYAFFPYYMFPTDGAILRYIRTHNHLFLLLLPPPHYPVFTHWECVVCMVLYDALCIVTYGISVPRIVWTET
jgi:hypothetical protein